MTWTCAVCGTERGTEDRFCSRCGTEKRVYRETYDVFISYRREGGIDAATVVQMALEGFGKSVFLDVLELQVGRFDERLLSVIEKSDTFILVMSPRCLDRCANKNDWFKREIMHALALGKRIIPVYLPGFAFPEEEAFAALPDEMRVLPNLQAVVWDAANRNASMRRILDAMAAADHNARTPSVASFPAKTGRSPAHDREVTSVAVAPDGHILATAGMDRHLRLWSLGDTVTLRREIPHDPPVGQGGIRFSPRGTRLVTLSVLDQEHVGVLSFFRMPEGELMARRAYAKMPGDWGESLLLDDVSFSPDDAMLAMTSIGTARFRGSKVVPWSFVPVWSMENGQQLMEIDAQKSLGFSSDGRQVAVVTGRHNPDIDTGQDHESGISICDVPSVETVRLALPDMHSVVFRLNPEWNQVVVRKDRILSVLSFPEGNTLRSFEVPALDSAGMKECLLFSADGKHCVWWSNRGKARFFDLADNFASQVVAAYDADLNWRPAYLAPDGRNMVVLVWKGLLGCEPPPSDPCLRLFSVPDGRLQLKLGLACPPLCGAYAPNSAEFYSGGLDGRIHRWDLERGTSTGEVTR